MFCVLVETTTHTHSHTHTHTHTHTHYEATQKTISPNVAMQPHTLTVDSIYILINTTCTCNYIHVCTFLSGVHFISFSFLGKYSDKSVRNAAIAFPLRHIKFVDLAPPNSCVDRGHYILIHLGRRSM